MVGWKRILVAVVCCIPLAAPTPEDGAGRESDAEATYDSELKGQDKLLNAGAERPTHRRSSFGNEQVNDAAIRRNLARRVAYHEDAIVPATKG